MDDKLQFFAAGCILGLTIAFCTVYYALDVCIAPSTQAALVRR